MTEREVQTHYQDMYARCLLESTEFLFKAGLLSQNTSMCCNEPLQMYRARSLFHMKEYYQAAYILCCKKADNVYEYCICCTREAVFLRNYSMYIHAHIKQEDRKDLVVEGVIVPNKHIERQFMNSIRMGGKETTFFDSSVFDDPYIVFHLLLCKSAYFTDRSRCKALLYLVKRLPYLWDIYKMLEKECTFSNIHSISSHIPVQEMKELFLLYLGAKKCILHKCIKSMVDKKLKTIDTYPEYVQSMIASVFGHLKQYKIAHEIFKNILESSAIRDNIDQLVNILYSFKEIDKLSSLLLTIYNRYYGLPIYHYAAGNLLSLKMNSIGSIEQFQKILSETYPGELDIAYLFMAHEYLILKDTSSAIKACNLAIKKNYNDHRVWSNMAQIYFEIDMFDYALHFYRKCAELAPENAKVYEDLGRCFEKLEKEEESIRCYKKSAALGNINCYAHIGDIFHKAKNVPQYKKYYTKYLNASLLVEKKEEDIIQLDVIEKIIETLEGVADSDAISNWRKHYNLISQDKLR